ncbi:DUF3267 domain-containing protein [Olsenella profusa]|uniref:DUF3267 domain-containing protein n=1 Tax=Olsenella profusa TaxID=138595 RepID=A0ABS2F453_9ACTN|nr:DUF3267 domain-containing protein [Olsenella profusa]MBM6775603.1 DUF3267 domain-containing protein [Olsenella profusa]
MRLLADIDVLGDAALQGRIARLSGALALVGLAGGVAAGLASGADGGAVATPWWWVALVAATFLALPVHELVHAAAFKLLAPGCRVTFGLEGAFLYTSAAGTVLPRGRMVVVLLAPSVVVTAALALGALAAGCPALAVLLAAAHLAGCAGDLLMAVAVLREPACTHVRDTEHGIDLLSDSP